MQGGAIVSFLNSLFGRLEKKLDVIKVRYQSVDFFNTKIKQISFNSQRRNPMEPTYKFKTEQKIPVRLQNLQIIFDDPPDENYRPRVIIQVNSGIIFETVYDEDTENPFLNADLNLDFGTGKTLQPNDEVKLLIWFDGEPGTKKVTLSYNLGEYC